MSEVHKLLLGTKLSSLLETSMDPSLIHEMSLKALHGSKMGKILVLREQVKQELEKIKVYLIRG